MAEIRRGGSNVAAVITAIVLVAASVPLFAGKVSKEFLCENKGWIGGTSALIFAAVLIWWRLSDKDQQNRNSTVEKIGIGNDTITMVVTVITALIAIVALLNP